MSKWISNNRRLALYQKHDFRCYYCGEYLTTSNATIDHLIPRQRGGSNVDENLVTACRNCNSSKALKTIDEFRLYITLNKVTAPVVYSQCQVDQLHKAGLFPALGVTTFHKFYFEVKQ